MPTSMRKRNRERARAERQQAKEARRAERKNEPTAPRASGEQDDPDLAGLVPGPQPPPNDETR